MELELEETKKKLAVLKSNQLEVLGKLIWNERFEITPEIKPIQNLLFRQLAFFGDFVELTEGKKVQMRLTTENNYILVEIFSFNGATKELIDRKFEQFHKTTVDFAKDKNSELDPSIINSNQDKLLQKIAELEIKGNMRGFSADKELKEGGNELRGITNKVLDIFKIVAHKLPDNLGISNSFNDNQNSKIAVGDNNFQNDVEDQLYAILDLIFEERKKDLKPSEKNQLDRLENDINKAKSGGLENTKVFLEKWSSLITSATTVGGVVGTILQNPITQTAIETLKNLILK
jgi:hypothetical protein